jgi:CDP-diglyceride synthetase
LTGLVGAPLIFVIIFFGQQIGLLFLILAATGQGLIEFYRLALPEARLWEKVAGLGLGLLFPLVAYVGQGEMILGAMAIAVFVLLLLFIATPENLSDVIPRMAAMLLGILYVGLGNLLGFPPHRDGLGRRYVRLFHGNPDGEAQTLPQN